MKMQQQKFQDSGYAPSFSCYSSDSITSTAVAKVIREEQVARFQGEDFEFSIDEQVSAKETYSRGWTVFKHDLLLVNDETKTKDDEIDASSATTGSLGKLFIGEREESSSYSSSEADELESPPSGTYCVWRSRAEGGSSPKCKKSSSTASGSKRWIFRYLLRRSNSEGKEPMVLFTPKKVDIPKQKRKSGEVSKVGGRWKTQSPVHEQFYVQRRAENEVGKRKSYLPYRKDLVGLFANVNGMGKMLPF